MCKSMAFMAAELIGCEQWVEKETTAHAKTVEEANLTKVELEDARAKILEVTKKVVTLETSGEELKEKARSLCAQLESATSVVRTLK